MLFPKQFQHLCTSSDFNEFESKHYSFRRDAVSFQLLHKLPEYDRFILKFCSQYMDSRLGPSPSTEMVPWYFAYDNLNYARYLPEMLDVPDICSSVVEYLAAGNFVVQQQNQYKFSQTSMDQTIEKTMNRDSKIRSGQIGLMLMLFIGWIQQCAEISWSCTETRKAKGSYKKKKTLVSPNIRRMKRTFKISCKQFSCCKIHLRSAFNKFSDFFVQAFKIVIDSWKFPMLLLYILWDD